MSAPDGPHRDRGSVSDYLANERTLLAWVRTSITLMALGFVVARFGLLLRELASKGGGLGKAPSAAPYIGVLLVLAGVVLAIIGITRFVRTRGQLQGGRFESEIRSVLVMIGLVIAAGLALTAYLILTG